VACHELAHLLLGHAGKIDVIRAECDADMFAMLCVGSKTWPNRPFGVASVFALIDIIEAERGQSPSHPSARQRLAIVAMQAHAIKAKIDWQYVVFLLKAVLDGAAEELVGRRVLQEMETKGFDP
jgi:hypothetical protein